MVHKNKLLALSLITTLLLPSALPIHAENSMMPSPLIIQDIIDKQNPQNEIRILLPAKELEYLSQNAEITVQLIEENSNTPIPLEGKVAARDDMRVQGNTVFLQKTQSTWASILTISNVEKKRDATALTYRAQLRIHDGEGTVRLFESKAVRFDTTAPMLTKPLKLSGLMAESSAEDAMLYSPTSTIYFTYGITDESNGTKKSSFPIELNVFADPATPLMKKTIKTEGSYFDHFDMGKDFTGPVFFNFVDQAGNTTSIRKNIAVDSTSPQSFGNTPVVAEQSRDGKELLLHMAISDKNALDHKMEVSWKDGTKKTFALPNTLFSEGSKVLRGSYGITLSELSGFPDGKASSLAVTFFDKAGNSMLVRNIATNVDITSPVVHNLGYVFNNDKSQLDMKFDVSDASAVSVSMDGHELSKEQGGNGGLRTVQISAIAVAGKKFPLPVSVSDGKNTPTTFYVDEDFTLVQGKRTADNKIPLTYMLSSQTSGAQVEMKVSGGNLSNPLRDTFQGLTNSLFLKGLERGTYRVESTVRGSRFGIKTYNTEVQLKDGLIPPTLSNVAIISDQKDQQLISHEAEGYYSTKEDQVRLTYQVDAPGSSYPIIVKLNGQKVDTITSPSNSPRTIPVKLTLENEKMNYTLTVSDGGSNNSSASFSVMRDTRPPQNLTVALVESTSKNKLAQSERSGLFITKEHAVDITVQGSSDKREKLTVNLSLDGKSIAQALTMEENTPGSPLLSIRKNAVELTQGKNNKLTVEIIDEHGNSIEQSYTIATGGGNPKIISSTFEDGQNATSSLNTALFLQAEGTGILRYHVQEDGQDIAIGELDMEGKSIIPLSLAKLGENTFTVYVEDELGNRSPESSTKIFLDYKNPLFRSFPSPWADTNKVSNVKMTLSRGEKVYSGILTNKAQFSLSDLTAQLNQGKVNKIAIGTYTLEITPLGAPDGIEPALYNETIEITPYYFDMDGDLNGDGVGSTISDEKLYISTRKQGGIYEFTTFTAMEQRHLQLMEELKEACKNISKLINTKMVVEPETFFGH